MEPEVRGVPIYATGRGGQVSSSSINPGAGDRYLRVVAWVKDMEVSIDVIDTHDMDRLSLSVTRAGGKIVFIVKPWLYEKIVKAIESGPNS